ncbi:MAG: hypothetical protein ACPHJD_01005 [Poseidonia sp.]
MSTRSAVVLVLCMLLTGCTSPGREDTFVVEQEVDDGLLCNGLSVLCDRSYDNVTFPETHNAFATHEDGIFYPASNHRTGLDAQWEAGIRAFMLDTHYLDSSNPSSSGVRFCHGNGGGAISPCVYGSVNAVTWLSELNQHMAEAPSDVVTLLIENYVEADDLVAVLEEAGLMEMAYVHTLNEPWPTLRELVEQNQRMVLFWEQAGDTGHPYFHDFLTFSWTTDYAEESKEEMDCAPHRGDATQVVFHMNNWLSGPLGLSSPNNAEETNDPAFLIERATECFDMHGKRPTFIAVDWWEDGDVVAAALAVNQLELSL